MSNKKNARTRESAPDRQREEEHRESVPVHEDEEQNERVSEHLVDSVRAGAQEEQVKKNP